MPEKVKVKYKGETYNINKSYIEGLKGYERRKQIKSILEKKDRPEVKGFKSKRSGWVAKFENKYKVKISDKSFIDKNIIKREGMNKIIKKGMGAYYSGGSRPNQTPFSWGLSRLASVIMNGPARKVDKKLWDEFKV